MADDEASARRGISEAVNSVENPSNSSDQSVPENVIVIKSEEEAEEAACVSGAENGNSNASANVLGSGKASSVGERKMKDPKDDEHSCVIDIKSGGGKGELGENLDGERICRICHLNADPSSETPPRPPTTTTVTMTTATTTGLIELGCDCKEELGIVHTYCAEAWFKLKGNRQCEICGETAKNITGVGDNRFMDEWNETRAAGSGVTNLSERGGGCWRGQPFCNFLMACLVIAFVMPWFFRVNMF